VTFEAVGAAEFEASGKQGGGMVPSGCCCAEGRETYGQVSAASKIVLCRPTWWKRGKEARDENRTAAEPTKSSASLPCRGNVLASCCCVSPVCTFAGSTSVRPAVVPREMRGSNMMFTVRRWWRPRPRRPAVGRGTSSAPPRDRLGARRSCPPRRKPPQIRVATKESLGFHQ